MTTQLQHSKKQNYFKRIVPQSRYYWKVYFSKTWPIIVGEILFCLNGFLDNFMVSHIPSGIDALTYANTYTGILYTIFFAIQGIAAMFVGQYYGTKSYDKVKQIINLRIIIFLFISISFAIVCWSMPTTLIYLIGGNKIKDNVIGEARLYLMLIAISWVIISFNFNTNTLLNETGHSNLAFISASLTLVSNIAINSILLYAIKGKAYYAAFGTIASGLICLTSDSLLTYYKDRPIFINILKLFHITKPITKQILRRIPAMLLTIAAMIILPIRMIIWSRAYPDDLIRGSGISEKWMGLSAVTVLGLVESLSSIASAITSVCSTNVSYFVAGNLGQNNFDEAEKHAYSLRGFHALAGLGMSILMIIVVLIIGYSKNTTRGAENQLESNIQFYFNQSNPANNLEHIFDIQIKSGIIDRNIILNAKDAIKTYADSPNNINFQDFLKEDDPAKWVAEMKTQIRVTFRRIFLLSCISFLIFNPIWCWFYTTAALPRAGGRNIIGSLTILVAFWSSFIWLLLLAFVIVPKYNLNIELTYFLYYSFDFIRLIIFEVIALKTNWKRNITNEIKQHSDA